MKSTLFEANKSFVFKDSLKNEICHASTLALLPNGDLFCAWFQGSTEGAPDVKIYGTIRRDGLWESPVVLAGHNGVPCWNPVLYVRQNGELVLYYKVGEEIALWQTMCKISQDNGSSWSETKELVPGDAGGRGPVRNKILKLKSGRLLAPASLENGSWRAFADISDDDGITWRKSEEVTISLPEDQKVNRNFTKIPVSEQSFKGRGVIQPTFWESGEAVHMLMRSTEGQIYHSISKNEGECWSEALPTGIPNNNSGIDTVKSFSGNVYLVCNPVGESWGKRTPICLLCSEGGGNNWEQVMLLDKGAGEFSYPAILCEGNTLYITYTWKRESIAFWEIKIRE